MAKTVYYQTNGSGRDSYIKANNGGMTQHFKPNDAPPIGTFSSKRTYFSPSPVVASKTVYYKSDGSGRDSYVTSTHGGFHAPGTGKRPDKAFQANLRHYDSSSLSPTKPGLKTVRRGLDF
jgi:hypothetical protein